MKLLKFLYGPQELGQTFFRYLPAVLNSSKRISLKKVMNAIHAEFERKIKRTKVKAHPFILHIELTNVCNLKCPYCLTGNDTNMQKKGYLDLDGFKKIIDSMKDYLVIVRMDGLGESFLNKQFVEMVEYATQNNIISAVSSNFVRVSADDIDRLIDAGLDYLIVGLDGASEEVYQKVRPGGTLEDVVSNIRHTVNSKKAKRSRTPFLETQYITFEENAHESDKTKELSHSLGVDRHLTKDLRDYAENVGKYKAHKPKSCYWLWYVLNVTWKGELKACCLAGLASDYSFGNILNNDIHNEWNNKNMQNIRQLFRGYDEEISREFDGCICLECYKLKGI